MRLPNGMVSTILAASTALAAAESPLPPVAVLRPHEIVSPHGTRIDPYYWLRDDTRSKPEVLEYLKAENAYFEAVSAPYKRLTETVTQELFSRVKQDDSSVPYKYKDYVYYTRFEAGREYPIHARRALGSLVEQILVDESREAAGKDYYAVGALAVSPKQDLLAFTDDEGGRYQHTLRFREIATGRDLPERISGLRPGIVWAGDNRTVYYVENDPVTLLSTRVKKYPALLVTTGLHDSQVQYYEPAKWVARLRATKTDANPLLFKVNMAASHGGRSGRFESLKETAEEYAFFLHLLGVDE